MSNLSKMYTGALSFSVYTNPFAEIRLYTYYKFIGMSQKAYLVIANEVKQSGND
jgi:hypothetical protein